MTTADMSLVAKESILVEKLKKNMPAQFFCPILYIQMYFACMYLKSCIWKIDISRENN